MTDPTETQALRRAIETARPLLLDDAADALQQLVELFEPYAGDPVDEARARSPMPLHCGHCGFEMPGAFVPAEATRAMRAAWCLAQCPRCYSTNMRIGAAEGSRS